MRYRPAWAAWLAVLLIAGAARGDEARRVAFVLRGVARDENAAELLARLRGELRAARFEVEEVASAGAGAPREIVEREARRPGITAAMGIFLDGTAAEIWVADARSTRAIMATVGATAGPGNDGDLRALAAKAIDLLKAVLSDVPLAEPAPPAAAPPAPPAPVQIVAVAPAPPAREPPRAADRVLSAGVGWLRAGDTQTVAPLLSLSLVARHLGARATVSGLGSSADLSATAGTAQVGQHVGLVELLACVRRNARLLACGAVGGGAELLTVHGTGAPGFQGDDHALWSAVGALGAGVAWMPRPWIAFSLDARALGAWPATDIRIDTSVTHAGGPGVWVTAGIGARL
jgi:hypothetical protein